MWETCIPIIVWCLKPLSLLYSTLYQHIQCELGSPPPLIASESGEGSPFTCACTLASDSDSFQITMCGRFHHPSLYYSRENSSITKHLSSQSHNTPTIYSMLTSIQPNYSVRGSHYSVARSYSLLASAFPKSRLPQQSPSPRFTPPSASPSDPPTDKPSIAQFVAQASGG